MVTLERKAGGIKFRVFGEKAWQKKWDWNEKG